MENEFLKRGYLLPDGYKDLSEVPKYQVRPAPPAPEPLPPVIGEMAIEEQMTVRQLAGVLKQKPYQIVADLMKIGVLATVDYLISFDAAAKVVRKYGYIAKRKV